MSSKTSTEVSFRTMRRGPGLRSMFIALEGIDAARVDYERTKGGISVDFMLVSEDFKYGGAAETLVTKFYADNPDVDITWKDMTGVDADMVADIEESTHDGRSPVRLEKALDAVKEEYRKCARGQVSTDEAALHQASLKELSGIAESLESAKRYYFG